MTQTNAECVSSLSSSFKWMAQYTDIMNNICVHRVLCVHTGLKRVREREIVEKQHPNAMKIVCLSVCLYAVCICVCVSVCVSLVAVFHRPRPFVGRQWEYTQSHTYTADATDFQANVFPEWCVMCRIYADISIENMYTDFFFLLCIHISCFWGLSLSFASVS